MEREDGQWLSHGGAGCLWGMNTGELVSGMGHCGRANCFRVVQVNMTMFTSGGF